MTGRETNRLLLTVTVLYIIIHREVSERPFLFLRYVFPAWNNQPELNAIPLSFPRTDSDMYKNSVSNRREDCALALRYVAIDFTRVQRVCAVREVEVVECLMKPKFPRD